MTLRKFLDLRNNVCKLRFVVFSKEISFKSDFEFAFPYHLKNLVLI